MWKAESRSLQLTNGAQVGIVGGGPAGSFFALHLLQYAADRGITLTITIFEGRDFDRAGPPGCAKCAGLLSAGLQQNLRDFGLTLPEKVIQSKADSYVLHLADRQVEIFPPTPHREITSVYRGSGPRLAPLGKAANFDAWLLAQAEQAGATVIPMLVTAIHLTPQPAIETVGNRYPVDFLVLASGVNGRRITLSGLNYRPPKTKTMVQDELINLPGAQRRVHVYFGYQKGIVFGATVPKGNMVNISLLGKNMNLNAVATFLAAAGISSGYRRLCGCKPHIPVSIARRYYADRFVAIGDAAVSRLYKDGIGSAFRTARRAAHTAVQHGIHTRAFKEHYAPLCHRIALDNFWGKLLFSAWEISGRIPLLAHLWLVALTAGNTPPEEANRCRLALWNMFTGDDSYWHILQSLIHPRILWFLLIVGRRVRREKPAF